MKIQVITIGKTDEATIVAGIQKYEKRLTHYTSFRWQILPDIKNVKHLTEAEQKHREGAAILKCLQPNDFLILLDEKGKQLTSVGFAGFLEQHQNRSTQQLIFVIGGPYGFDEEVYKRANYKLSLSSMTFSHQMIRLFFVEQVYRAFTIIKGEPYHHM
jgi:23S rRNA (pseudouridine1915-N3)-methyltransferase